MTRVIGPPRSRRRRWTFLWCLVVVLSVGLLFVAGALSNPPQTAGYMELDKNAVNDQSTYHLGTLKAAIRNATDTTFVICERTGGGIPLGAAPPPVAPFTVLIDGELMRVTNTGTSSNKTGGCSFSDPADTTFDVRTFTVTRGYKSTTATAHPGGSDVTTMVDPAIDVPPAFSYDSTVAPTVTGTDWDSVFALANGSTADNPCASITDAVACAYGHREPGGTAFTTGGSKDDLNINDFTTNPASENWQWTNTSVPDADEINDAVAIKFQNPAPLSHQFLYFAADRFATNGSKDFGFWFFKSPVQADPNGTFTDDQGNLATHTVGDVLILGTFTQGGAIGSVRTFTWDPANADTNGTLKTGPVGPDCVPGGSSDLCNTINNTTVPAPWAYTGKGSVATNVFYSGGFLEGGIDLTAAGLEGCFSSFMAETRSSPEVGAQLKAFILQKFQPCGATIATSPSSTNTGSGTPIDANGISVGTGNSGVDIYDKATVTVTGTSSFNGSVTFHLCGPTPLSDANYTLCATGGALIGSAKSIGPPSPATVFSDVAHLTEAGRYCWRGDYSGDPPNHIAAKSDSLEHECFKVIPVQPALTTCSGTYGGDPLTCTPAATVDFGNPITDRANLTGTAYRPGTGGGSDGSINPTARTTMAKGTIRFDLYGPDNCTLNAGFATANPNGIVVNVNGDGVYSAGSFVPSAPGVYHWKASYSGDSAPSGYTPPGTGTANTLGVSQVNSACSDTNEDVTVRQIPTTIATAQSAYPNDSGTITSTVVGDNLPSNGTVVFRLYGPTGGGTPQTALQNCQAHGDTVGTGGLLYKETKNNVGGQNSVTVSTTNGNDVNTAVSVNASGTYYWRVTYATGDTAHTGRQSDCVENTVLTFNNDAGPGSLFP